jgi:hypothetical protein
MRGKSLSRITLSNRAAAVGGRRARFRFRERIALLHSFVGSLSRETR